MQDKRALVTKRSFTLHSVCCCARDHEDGDYRDSFGLLAAEGLENGNLGRNSKIEGCEWK